MGTVAGVKKTTYSLGSRGITPFVNGRGTSRNENTELSKTKKRSVYSQSFFLSVKEVSSCNFLPMGELVVWASTA